MKLAIVIGSVRKQRVSDRLARWLQALAQAKASDHSWDLVDLKDFDLPMFDEPKPPMAGDRPELSDGVQRYLQAMDSADGFIIVSPEYNHGISSALKNAIDLIDFQLMKKPIAIASHGVVGGARANEQVRLVVNSNIGGLPIPASLAFRGKVGEQIDPDGVLSAGADEANLGAAKAMIESLIWHAQALKTAREK